MNRLLETALQAHAHGWSVVPIHAGNERDKQPHSGLLSRAGYTRKGDEGQVQASWKPLQSEQPSVQTLETWFTRSRELGLALVTGQISGRFVIDFDGDEGRAYADGLGIRPHVRTAGGYHWHIRMPPWRVYNLVGKATAGAVPCVDVRGDGGLATLPPTVTRKGPYTWLRRAGDPDTLDDVPETLRTACRLSQRVAAPFTASGPLPQGEDRFPAERILDWALGRVQAGQGGGRNDTGSLMAWVLYNNGYADHEVASVGAHYVAAVGGLHLPAYTPDEFHASMRGARSAGRGEPWVSQTRRDTSASAACTLEDVYPALSADQQARGAFLLASEWYAGGHPVSETISYLRLIGCVDAPATVRRAALACERGETPGQTLADFMGALGGLDNGRRQGQDWGEDQPRQL